MKQHMRTFKYTCDTCYTEEVVIEEHDFVPAGWIEWRAEDTTHSCESCNHKAERDELGEWRRGDRTRS